MVVDIGTGDGLFVYRSARSNPQMFFIGIDANSRPLEKISEKIYRKPAKGGLPNALFLESAVETLGAELEGTANEVHINFPWGSLLRAVALGEETVLRNLRQMCAAGAFLRVVIGVDVERDRAELDRLGIRSLDVEYLREVLPATYAKAGFEIVKTETLAGSSLTEVQTSWAKRLKAGHNRSFVRIVARAV